MVDWLVTEVDEAFREVVAVVIHRVQAMERGREGEVMYRSVFSSFLVSKDAPHVTWVVTYP